MKNCSRCKLSKSTAEFYKRADNRSADGLESCCKDCSKEKKRIWYSNHSSDPEVRFKHAKATSKGRGLSFVLSLKQYSEYLSKGCQYCQASIVADTGTGLDRLDSNKGYTVSNVVPCCEACNKGRNVFFSPQEWQVMIDALKEWRKAGYSKTTPLLIVEPTD